MSNEIEVNITVRYKLLPEAFHVVNFFDPGSVTNETQAIAHTEECIREHLDSIFDPEENPQITVKSTKLAGDRNEH